MKQSFLNLLNFFLLINTCSLLFSMEKPLEMQRGSSLADREEEAARIQTIKDAVKKAKRTEKIRMTLTAALKESQHYWFPILSYAIDQAEEKRGQKKLRIFAELLLPKIDELNDIMVIGLMSEKFTKAFGQKKLINKDGSIYKVLEALDEKEAQLKKRLRNATGSLILRRRGAIESQGEQNHANEEAEVKAKNPPPPVPAREEHAVLSSIIPAAKQKPTPPARTTSLPVSAENILQPDKPVGPAVQDESHIQSHQHVAAQVIQSPIIKPLAPPRVPDRDVDAKQAEKPSPPARTSSLKLLLDAAVKQSQEPAQAEALSPSADETRTCYYLYTAAIKGDAEEKKMLIAAGATINAKNMQGWTALTWAVNEGILKE